MYERHETREVELNDGDELWSVLHHVEAVAHEAVARWGSGQFVERVDIHTNHGQSRARRLSDAREGVRSDEITESVEIIFGETYVDARTRLRPAQARRKLDHPDRMLWIKTSLGAFLAVDRASPRLLDSKLYLSAKAPNDHSARGITDELADAVRAWQNDPAKAKQLEPLVTKTPVTALQRARAVATNRYVELLGGGLLLAFLIWLFGWN